MRGPPTLFESDFIAFSCCKMAGCLSEEELEIAINKFKWQFCSGFLVMSAYYIKAQFQVCHVVWISEFCISALAAVKYVFTLKRIYFITFCYIDSIFGQFYGNTTFVHNPKTKMVFTDLKVLRGMGKVNKKRKAGKINWWTYKTNTQNWSEYTNVQRKTRIRNQTNHKVNKPYHLITYSGRMDPIS
jgi:hypothetical protein